MSKSENAIAAPKKEKNKYGKWDKWEIENAADTLIKAEEIKGDKEKMKYVSKCLEDKAKETKKAITSIEGLKAEFKTKYGHDE